MAESEAPKVGFWVVPLASGGVFWRTSGFCAV